MRWPIISGIYASGADFRTALPVNLIPVPKVQGISEGYLRPADGIISQGSGPGRDRGGVAWRGVHYRVMGSAFVSIAQDGTITSIGAVDGDDFASFDQSFDHLGINCGSKLYLYDGTTFTQVTDVDLGVSLDVAWLKGQWYSTDGDSIVASDIADPFSYGVFSYASSEAFPDPIVAVTRVRNELYALNRNSIEVFSAQISGGAAFPLGLVEGAQINKGVIGRRSYCEYMEQVAFLGSGPNEPPSVYLGAGGQAQKVATREIDQILLGYTETDLERVVMESRSDKGHDFLMVHIYDRTLVFDGPGSTATQQPIWFELRSGLPASGYRARGHVWCYDRWNVADPFNNVYGYLDPAGGHHYGEIAGWEFATPVVYNEGRPATVWEIELVALNGTVDIDDDPIIATQWSKDGETWSTPRQIRAGRAGRRTQRLVFDRQGDMDHWRIQRFTGDTRARLSFARLEAQVS